MTKFSIIIPCRDEEENVKIVLKNIQDNCSYSDYEVIFINDFSTDTTEEILRKVSNDFENVFYFNNTKKGLGGTIQTGFNKSKGKYITIMMADSADSVEDLNSYFEIIE